MGWAQVSQAMALDPKVTPSEMRVYVAMATFRGDGGRSSPGIGTIAKHTGLSQATVKRAVACLIANGYLRVVRSGGGRTSNVYIMLGSNELTHAPGSLVTGVAGDRGHPCTGSGVTHAPAAGSPVSYEEEPITRTNNKNPAPTASPSVPAQLTLEQPTLTPTPAPKAKANPILSLFLELCPSIPPRQFRAEGKKAAAAAARAWKAEPDAELWRKRFQRAEASDFLTGRRLNDRGWRCDFLALMGKLEEIEAGRYDNREVAPSNYGPRLDRTPSPYRED